MPCNYPLVQDKLKLPDTLIKEYVIEGENEAGEIFRLHVADSHQRMVRHCVDWCVKCIRLLPIKTHGCDKFRVFGFEIK